MNDANNAARPVAFRVLKHRMSSGYDIYDNEDDAQFLAGERGVSYEGLYLVSDRNTWDCAARKQSLPEPADCDWPTCGCDPYADKVIASLEESGIDLSTPNASVEQARVAAEARLADKEAELSIAKQINHDLTDGITGTLQKDKIESLEARLAEAMKVIERDMEALTEADTQIEYLHDKFKPTGSGATAIARIDIALTAARAFTNAAKEKT